VPRIRAVGAEEEPRQLGASRAEQAGQAHDLPRHDGKVERLDHALAPDRLCLDDRLRGESCPRALREAFQGLEFQSQTAEHLRDECDRREVDRTCLLDEPARSQHGDAVGDLVDLLEEVQR
jgi:hypothetical protein